MNQQSLEKSFQRRFSNYRDNWKACCPFHDERSPSFFVHKEEFMANCFGCGVHGRIDNLLARYAGIAVAAARVELDIEAGELINNRLRRRDKQFEPKYYPESWLAPFKKEVHNYVIQRGFNIQILREAGSLYDHNQGRQVFPHRDREGRLLGAVGRDCRHQQAPKWYFYWGYDKGQGLFWVRDTGRYENKEQGSLLIVEGVFDALWLHQHGYTNVAAILGSKATQRQIREIKSSAERVVLGLDSDTAGRAGQTALRAALGATRQILTVDFPEGKKDWQELTKEEIDATIANASNVVQRRLKERKVLA